MLSTCKTGKTRNDRGDLQSKTSTVVYQVKRMAGLASYIYMNMINIIRHNHDTLKEDMFPGLIAKQMKILSTVRNSLLLEV